MKTTLPSKAAIAVFVLIFAAPTLAQGRVPDSAGKLAALCEHSAATIGGLKSADVNDGLCAGEIDGWRNVIDALPVLTPDRRFQIHIEASATDGQLMRVFVAYVKAHPEVENKGALLVFAWALKNAGLMTEVRPPAK